MFSFVIVVSHQVLKSAVVPSRSAHLQSSVQRNGPVLEKTTGTGQTAEYSSLSTVLLKYK